MKSFESVVNETVYFFGNLEFMVSVVFYLTVLRSCILYIAITLQIEKLLAVPKKGF